MAKNHASKFLEIVDDARSRIKECNVQDLKAILDDGQKIGLIDTREESEYAASRIPGAAHIGKGVIERDIERMCPDTDAPLYLYCGGGYRSALAADNLTKMGYTNVTSVDGGIGGWVQAGYPVDQ